MSFPFKVTLANPVNDGGLYYFRKTTPQGEPLDTSWWKHDMSPVVPILTWLMSKIPRRKMHTRHLDLNTFINYNEKGKIELYYNTDKVKNNKVASKLIPGYLVDKLFTKEELNLLIHYVDYIKRAYSDILPVEY